MKENPEDFTDIVLDVFKVNTKKIELTEGVIPITPFVAYAAFKKKVFNALKNSKLFRTVEKIKRTPTKIKAKTEIGLEKTRAVLGAPSGGTVYKLTNDQLALMARIYAKYGKELVDDILEFRRNILAPYQLIKRKVKSARTISSKDITGLTRDEYKAALESGRKKILARGKKYFERSKELQDRLAELNERLKILGKLKSDISKETPKIDYNAVNKLMKTFEVNDEELEGYPKEELRKVYDEIMRNYNFLLKARKEGIGYPELKQSIERSKKLWSGKTIDLTKYEKDKFFQTGNFNVALGKYFFSRNILNKLLSPGTSNIFKKTYESIIDEMIKRTKKLKTETLQQLITLRDSVKFNEKEKKVWEKLPTTKSFSGNLEDYYQKVTSDDFLEKPITIKRSPELIKAEEKIENEIKKFERKLKKTLTVEDYNLLKKYRLIGNLITIKELRDPNKLFKSKNEIEKDTETQEKKQGYITPAEYYRRLKEIGTVEYDTMAELNNAKKKAEELTQQMIDQGDEEVVDEYEDLLRQIKLRRTTEPYKLVGHELEPSFIVGIDDIRKLAKHIIEKNYTTIDELKQDNERLKKLVERYKKSGPDAQENLEEIKFLFDRINRKMTKEVTNLE